MYDLNVPWPDLPNDQSEALVKRGLEFRAELGYKVFAINFIVEAAAAPTFKNSLTPKVLARLREKLPGKCKILSRVTVVLAPNAAQAPKLANLTSQFELVALQVDSERALQSAATALDIDIISFDFGARQTFFVKHRIAAAAVARGVRFELPYGQAAGDTQMRRQAIANASSLIRATRGRGLLAASASLEPAHVRAPADVLNLLVLWGLDANRAHEALYKCSETTATKGMLRRRSHNEVVYVEEDNNSSPPKKKARTSA